MFNVSQVFITKKKAAGITQRLSLINNLLVIRYRHQVQSLSRPL